MGNATIRVLLEDIDTTALVEGADAIHNAKLSALETFCAVKRMAKLLNGVAKALTVNANLDFDAMRRASDLDTGWPIGGYCTLSNNKANGTWTLPSELVAEVNAANNKVKEFKKLNKDTHYKAGLIDPNKSPLFTVTINK